VRVQRSVASMMVVAGCLLVLADPAQAQSRPPSAQRTGEQAKVRLAQAQARFQVSVMEGVLERAVENAARLLNLQIQPTMPGLFVWGSSASARGFRLESYGVFFVVEVPIVRQSPIWALQIMDPPDEALRAIRDHVRTIQNVKERDQLDFALRQIELQFPARIPTGQSGRVKAGTVTPIDQNEVYTNAVTTNLVDAMLDHSGPLEIAADEWLTVAAGDYEGQRSVAADAPYDLVTIVMRIKGSDLQAFRAGRLTREEARKRVELKEF